MRKTCIWGQSDRRLRHHFQLDGQINPREWFNWHPKEFQPWHFDRHKFLYEQQQYNHVHHLLCQQAFANDLLRLVKFPEPTTVIIDCRMSSAKMHRWIPHSHWIPRDEVEYALQLDPDEFSHLYGFGKPNHTNDVILVSHCGHASEQAGWEFRKAFYTHVYNYRGGTNELFGESYVDFPPAERLKPWKGPFPQAGIFTDPFSKRKVLTRVGPFDRQYEMQDFSLPDLELEKKRHPDAENIRGHMPYGLQ